MSNPNPLATIPAAERALAAGLEAAANALDTVGTHRLTGALAHLQLAAARAEDRILTVRGVAVLAVSRVADTLDAIGTEFSVALQAYGPDEIISLAGPIASPSATSTEDEGSLSLAANGPTHDSEVVPEPVRKTRRGRKEV